MAVIDSIDIMHSPMVTLVGELDSDGCGRATDVLQRLHESGYYSPQIDLAGVRSMDSEGILAVIRWCNQFSESRGGFKVISVNPLVKRLFEIAGCSDIIHQSEEFSIPPHHDRQPITDCIAAAGDWELRSFSVAGRLDSCKIVRDRIDETASRMRFTDGELGDIKLAVGEAISNAIRHGCSENPDARVTIRVLATIDKLVIEMTDNGPGFNPDATSDSSMEALLPEGGMGIRFMRHCMDEVSFQFFEGTTIRLIKLVKP
ncbi:MAG: ATP-binding protein [Armatimonadota bacterium]